MDDTRRRFLNELLATASPSGFETSAQRVWLDYVSEFADEVRTDSYGNAVAVLEGGDPEIAFAGHCDEIALIVTKITEAGYLRLEAIGGADKTVTQGQHVTVHGTEDTVQGVIGQTPVHLRSGEEEYQDIEAQFVDIGADDGEAARQLVAVGDPVTFDTQIHDLEESRISARGLDNRIGVWAAAEALRRAGEATVDATVYAVSTVQEELGLKGAQMVGFDLDPDAALAVDVTHAADNPAFPGDAHSEVALGDGPVVSRGSANHPTVVEVIRTAASRADIDVQLDATGSRTGTDADGFYIQRGGIPSLSVGVPNRYMHTPTEVVDLEDLDATASLLAEVGGACEADTDFSVTL